MAGFASDTPARVTLPVLAFEPLTTRTPSPESTLRPPSVVVVAVTSAGPDETFSAETVHVVLVPRSR